MKIIGFDTESYYNTKLGIDIKSLGPNYVRRSDCFMISVSDGTDSWAGEPKEFNWDALEGATIVSHNASYDKQVVRAMHEKGQAPKPMYPDWHCTADMSAYLCNRRSLVDASKFLLGAELTKETRDYANGKTPEMIKADGRWEEMLSYARSDAFHCQQLFAKHSHLWPKHEQRLSEMTCRQGMRGIQIDLDKLRTYIAVASACLRIAEEQLPWVKEGKPPTSPKAIAELCRSKGIPCPPVKSREGEEAFLAWESAYCKAHPWIEHVANWRSINKFLDSLLTIQARMDETEVMGFSLKYFGAHTGRWSGDSGLNMQNLRKDPLFFDDRGWLISDLSRLREIGNVFLDSGKYPDYVATALDIRSLFIARPGKKLIISDLSQIEPRVLAWLVGDTAMLDLMRSGQSPYEAHARATMGFVGGNMKKEDKEGYALAKARVLGLGFGCGWEKFIVVAQAMAGLDITKDDPEFVDAVNEAGEPCFDAEGHPIRVSGYGYNSRRIVKEYRDANPKIVGLWNSLDEGFRNSVGGDFEAELPSGRKLVYRQVRAERRMVKQKDGTFKSKRVYTAETDGRRRVYYGGMITENVVQATAREVFAYHLLQLDEDPVVDVLFTAHDEAINETDPQIPKEHVEEIMSRCPDWLAGCPIAAEACDSAHYKK